MLFLENEGIIQDIYLPADTTILFYEMPLMATYFQAHVSSQKIRERALPETLWRKPPPVFLPLNFANYHCIVGCLETTHFSRGLTALSSHEWIFSLLFHTFYGRWQTLVSVDWNRKLWVVVGGALLCRFWDGGFFTALYIWKEGA